VGFVVNHADGAPYGARVSLPAADVARKVAGMLEHMGFKTREARALVEKALLAVTPNDASVLLQAALRAS
jgi:Holliday junction resolvasome RuvABC DNA-binding subunit